MFEKIIGFTCGAFDLLHVGHLHLLEYCKNHCDALWVGLHTDPTIDRPATKNKPVQTTFERYAQLDAVRCVDRIIPYDSESDLMNMMATLPIDVRFLGSDYIDKHITGQQLCQELGIRLVYVPRMHNYSTTELRNRINP